jgi:hypothetical protein
MVQCEGKLLWLNSGCPQWMWEGVQQEKWGRLHVRKTRIVKVPSRPLTQITTLYQYLSHLPKHRMQWHTSVYFKKWEGLCHMFINKRIHNNQTQFCYFGGNWHVTTEVNFKSHVCMQHKYICLFWSPSYSHAANAILSVWSHQFIHWLCVWHIFDNAATPFRNDSLFPTFSQRKWCLRQNTGFKSILMSLVCVCVSKW